MKTRAAVGVCMGKLNKFFSAPISIFSSSFSSPLFKFQDSALVSKLLTLIFSWSSKRQACIFLSFPPPGGGGKRIKGSGDEEGNLRGKKEKKRKFGENITFYSTKS